MEENELKNSKEETAGETVPDLGKFKSVDALLRAYGELEAEFTRRSQKLKALEEASVQKSAEAGAVREDDLYRMVNENEGGARTRFKRLPRVAQRRASSHKFGGRGHGEERRPQNLSGGREHCS